MCGKRHKGRFPDFDAPADRCSAVQHFASELRVDEGTGTSEWRNCYVSELSRGRSSTVSGRFVMDGIIYLVGLIVIVMFILSLLGLH
jgi:hypothetical protein